MIYSVVAHYDNTNIYMFITVMLFFMKTVEFNCRLLQTSGTVSDFPLCFSKPQAPHRATVRDSDGASSTGAYGEFGHKVKY